MNIGIENYHPKNNQKTPYDWTISRDTDFNGLGDANEFINFCEKKGIKKINNKEEFFPLLEEYRNAAKNQKRSASNFNNEDDYNPQSEVRYTSPEELKLSEMSEEDLKQGLEDIKRGVTDYTDAEEPVVTGWIKDELAKRKPKPKDEMENFTDSLNDYMDKNKKGRDDIPVTTRR